MARKFKPNKAGINSLMKTPEVGAEVRRVAQSIAQAAGSGDNEGIFKTDAALGRRRWRAAVIGNYEFEGSGGLAGMRRDLLRGLDGAHE
ncbi:hypothetical protein OU787_17310 [Kitasatospora sp. YST-16]|uniref:hypothetical protein n=1 Tax=Kitasatospora sp. YST-16 TaxID=2998080 RepID=UPI0022834AB0|nr:hypothetical protein [Kitasatospora sp. YST-16]WAL73109.1 hypothetical protein OU787_17310 [Kitasatospora sp. YST-16]WNW39163.1 hypothetical protein RKE32_17275 [Streptomyces sp. Li-HN-5-13]